MNRNTVATRLARTMAEAYEDEQKVPSSHDVTETHGHENFG